MGRSKFPGKPSKHVNRKRINVLPPSSETITECSSSMTVETVAENKQIQEETESSNENVNLNSSVSTKVSLRRRLSRKMQGTKALISNNTSKMGLMSKICNKSGVKTVSNKITVKNKINCKGTRKSNINRKSVHGYSSIKNFKQCRNESNNLVGKFVLPTRSVHSSRVIKPNKRFINVDLGETLTLKKKVINKRHCIKPDEQQQPEEASKSSSETDKSAAVLISESPTKTLSNGRVVLRQARLKLHNQTPKGSEGPFSSSSASGSPPGTVTCGVCGAVRFYRFVKQARKFNIYSCESCRKFISKLIKRQTCGKSIVSSTLVCHKGQGMCHVPPIVRSQQMKLIRCAYRSRCPACWLKMCLRSFQMPMSLKNSLVQLLPENMQGSDVIFSNSLPLLWQANVQTIDNRISNKMPECSQQTSIKPVAVKQRPVRFKNAKTVTNAVTSDVKRQKIDLKGPRVKHVCRSASIVLGQPLATFSPPPELDKKKENDAKKVSDNNASKTLPLPLPLPLLLSNNDNSEHKEAHQAAKTVKTDLLNFSESESSDSDKLPRLPLILNDNLVSTVKRDKNHRVPFSSSSCSSTSSLYDKFNDKKNNIQDMQNIIAIDYWENYDLDDISQNGFCLIASQQFPMPAICFLCGSAGREALLHCSLCCEPYHPFCLEQNPPISNNNNRQFMWLCPRCTTCNACNQTGRQKLNCQKCSKAYHSECLNNKSTDEHSPTICSKCLTCKGCGQENTTKFVGNLPLCIMCFKQRKKGNSCPICQGLYDDMDAKEMMMECTKCNKLIHSKCEGLSDEFFHILSILPESVKYLCNACSKNTTPYWRKAVDSELRFDFNQIIRLLSKNKTARNILKLSPLNNHKSFTKTATTVKKIQFSGSESDDINQNQVIDIFDNIDNNNKIFNEIDSETFSTVKVLSMLDIKNKLNSNEYNSVREFNREMEEALKNTQCEELLNIYRVIFQSVFPWFKPNQNEDDPRLNNSHENDSEFFLNTNAEEDICDQIECVGIDSRYCSFCKNIGDGLSHLESRLLYCGQNEWVHINCALWSSEVYEEIDGSLQNIPNALYRGRLIRCSYCKQKGATVGCCFKGCYETYHFICARTAKCHFMHNKTIYCGIHELPHDSHVISTPTEFNIRRSVFVELSNNKKGKYSQIDKVNVMVGSLCVTNLGKINPALSDSAETIIPSGYVCSRLYWSTVEPWKLVSYRISTSIFNANVSSFYVDKNFTVDHTLPKSVVERKLKEITVWHKDIDKKKSDIIEFEDEEEPQNGADLLSPEITDAIFEDLPHELLDGISVQDIFPKLMSYEDFISIDCKSETNNSDSGDVKKADEVDPLEFEEKSHQNKNQRSCSLTLSCKLDNSFSPVMKKRKIATSRDFFQLLQVDGNFDDSSSSECGSPTGNEQNIWDANSCEEPVTCERCQCTYRTQASYKRHLDSCDVMTSESDSELNQEHDGHGHNLETINMNVMESTLVMNMNMKEPPPPPPPPQPVVLASYESYQNEIHTSVLNTQTFVTSKSTTSELISVPQNEIIIPAGIHQIEQKTIPSITNLPIPEAVSNEAYAAVSHHHHHRSTLSINEQTNQSAQFCLNQNIPLCVNPPLTLQAVNSTASLLNQAIAINQPSLEFQQPSVTIQSLPYSNNVTPIITVAPQNLLSSNWGVKPISKPTARSPTKSKARRNIAAKRTHLEDDPGAIIIPQTATATSSAPSVIVQHLPSTNFIPTFVDAGFQQQSGQNVQYVATLAPHPQINSAIHSQPLMQLQSDSNLISLMPGMQPTMIIQQPRVLENQLVLDSNGSLSWAPQPVQPVYYGFETIVQNTVMQSQQFLPSTVPGVLTANSSYSTTTQVFQTSKLEPVLDVAANSFVLLNPSQLVSSQPIEVTQNTQPQTVNSLISNSISNSATNHHPHHHHNNVSHTHTHTHTPPPPNTNACKNKYSNNTFQKPNMHSTANVNANSITLPTAPFVLEQGVGIPTNIVTPTPKPITTQARPMSRVLPMQTVKDPPKIKIQEKIEILRQDIEKPPLDPAVFVTFEKSINENAEKEQIQVQECQATINRNDSLKLLFQKQSQDGTYKVCNNFIEKTLPLPPIITSQNNNNNNNNNNNGVKHSNFKPNQENNYKVNNNNNFNSNKSSSVQVAPLKPIKSNSIPQPFHVLSLADNKENRQEKERLEKKSFIDAKPFLNEKKENDNAPAILYTIETQDGFKYSSTSVVDLWTKVFETVQNARAAHNMPLLPPDSTNIMNSLQILGLKTSGLKYLIEQLPGAAKCTKYKPTYNFPSKLIEIEDEPIGHSSGCARSAPNIKRNDPYDMFGWLASRHRKPELLSDLFPRRGSANNLPMATRFRQLKLSSKLSVGVYRSKIHRRGLFCLRDFDAGEMVIEYSGEVIRSILTDKREKYYNSKGIGCYMFRIDDNLVVDATMTGNAARFINHSCDPNCYSKVVEILGHKHIIIFALRRIICGEELTYDYKFPIEEDKIPCTCGTRRCRKFLN